MATLLVTDSADTSIEGLRDSPPSLRAWLAGTWALVFSHPADFLHHDLENDRWLAVVQDGFARADVRPLSLARDADALHPCWVDQVCGDSRLVVPEDRPSGSSRPADLCARKLREELAATRGRFVTMVDAELRRRRTFAYARGQELPSPLDFLGWYEDLKDVRAAPPEVRRPAPLLRRFGLGRALAGGR